MLTVNSVYDRKITYSNGRMEMWMRLCFRAPQNPHSVLFLGRSHANTNTTNTGHLAASAHAVLLVTRAGITKTAGSSRGVRQRPRRSLALHQLFVWTDVQKPKTNQGLSPVWIYTQLNSSNAQLQPPHFILKSGLNGACFVSHGDVLKNTEKC